VIQTGSIAAVAVVFGKYLGVLVPALGTDNAIWKVEGINLQLYLPWMSEAFFEMKDFTISAGQLVAVVVIAFLTGLNCRGVEEGKVVQNTFTVAKTLALVVLIVVGLAVVSSPAAREINTADLWGGMQTTASYEKMSGRLGQTGLLVALMVMGGAMVGALFSADAWNNITFTAGEVRNPRRNLPLSLVLGAGTVIVLYLLANLAYLASLPVRGDPQLDARLRALEKEAIRLEAANQETQANAVRQEAKELLDKASTFERGIAHAKDQRVGTAVMELWSPTWGAYLMAIAIMVSTFGCVNGMVLMGAWLYYAMAKDNLFFQGVGRLNRRAVPAVGLILQGVWAVLLVFSGSYDELLEFVIFAVLVFYVLTVSGLFILRRTRPDAERPYKAFGYPVLPAVYVLLCAAIMLNLLIVKPKYTWPGLILVVAGIPVYFVWRFLGRKKV
jgi:APA family basic amino acid/polyamine antiporter